MGRPKKYASEIINEKLNQVEVGVEGEQEQENTSPTPVSDNSESETRESPQTQITQEARLRIVPLGQPVKVVTEEVNGLTVAAETVYVEVALPGTTRTGQVLHVVRGQQCIKPQPFLI